MEMSVNKKPAGMKRAAQHTSSAAVLATGAELSRRGYDVTFTLGNTRRVDMLCSVPDGQPFKIQVKGISNATGLWIDNKFFEGGIQADLFLVVVLVPPLSKDAPFRFFILKHADAKDEFSKMPQKKRDGTPFGPLRLKGPGLNWGLVKPYENAWGMFPLIPRQLSGAMQPPLTPPIR
ncbi:MAG: hypothetical protein ACLQVM_29705 [Terriglobia bacterium]